MAKRINFVEKHHTGRLPACLLEEFVNVALAVADVGIEDVREADREEFGPQLTGDGPRDEGLTASRRAVHEQAAAQALAVERSQFRIAERGQERGVEPILDARHAADVGQGDARPLRVERRDVGGAVTVDKHRVGQVVDLVFRR